jgi:hypothetical protein
MTPKSRTIGPESEDRRTDNPAATNGEGDGAPKRDRDSQRRTREAGVESLPDGEDAAEDEAAKARDD